MVMQKYPSVSLPNATTGVANCLITYNRKLLTVLINAHM